MRFKALYWIKSKFDPLEFFGLFFFFLDDIFTKFTFFFSFLTKNDKTSSCMKVVRFLRTAIGRFLKADYRR